jgi:hypothetical protein
MDAEAGEAQQQRGSSQPSAADPDRDDDTIMPAPARPHAAAEDDDVVAVLATAAGASDAPQLPPPPGSAISALEGGVSINRGPVLTLWIAVVAKQLGSSWDTAVSVGRAFADMCARSKGERLGFYNNGNGNGGDAADRMRAQSHIRIANCDIDTELSETGTVVAVSNGKPWHPKFAQTYLQKAFGEDLVLVKAAMERLAASFRDRQRLSNDAYSLYCQFRPKVADGVAGWGQKGLLSVAQILSLCQK